MSAATQDPQMVIHKSDLLTWGKVAAIVASLLGATWKLSGDAADIRNSVGILQKDEAEIRTRLSRHDDLIDLLTKQVPTVKQVEVLDSRVDAVMAVNATLTSGQAASTAQSAQFFGTTWPAVIAELKRIEDKLDVRRP